MRKKIPQITSDEILFKSNHTCAICRVKNKDVQLHHIDGNHSNNKPNNLIVVCLDCHSKLTGKSGLGKSFSFGEVRKYKRAWENHVLESRKVHRPIIKYRKELITQIDIIICDILSRKSNSPRVSELFELLFEIHLWRGSKAIDNKIIEGLHHLSLMSGLSSPRLATFVAEKLYEMCFHFVGPEYVDMNKSDVSYVLNCIDSLNTLANFNCEFGKGRKAIEHICENAENFFEIGLWYSNKTILNKVIKLYKEAIHSCKEDEKSPFSYGVIILKKSLRKNIMSLKDFKKKYNYQLQKMNTHLKYS